jgi:hypothetical protein
MYNRGDRIYLSIHPHVSCMKQLYRFRLNLVFGLALKAEHYNPYTVRTRVGFEVLRAVTMKSTIFCDVTPCSPIAVHSQFR